MLLQLRVPGLKCGFQGRCLASLLLAEPWVCMSAGKQQCPLLLQTFQGHLIEESLSERHFSFCHSPQLHPLLLAIQHAHTSSKCPQGRHSPASEVPGGQRALSEADLTKTRSQQGCLLEPTRMAGCGGGLRGMTLGLADGWLSPVPRTLSETFCSTGWTWLGSLSL